MHDDARCRKAELVDCDLRDGRRLPEPEQYKGGVFVAGERAGHRRQNVVRSARAQLAFTLDK